MEFYGNAVYRTNKQEMDEVYPRCTHDCGLCSSTCMYNIHLADSDDQEPFASWCTEKKAN